MFAGSIALPFNLSFNLLNLLGQQHPIAAPIAVSLGAVPGALSRYYVTVLFGRWLGTRFPFGTFFINLSGSLLMGFFATLFIDRVIASSHLQLLITTGFLGAYTTFSTYALDTSILLQNKNYQKALLYGLGSSIFGGICLAIGIAIAHLLSGEGR
ncbi:fluoride efflux transporter CrcB [Leptolyngbya ohadii]|uniref:fluoride efflux transporter CrcB n=1 Tax=Leptolyngbya ohadii TaxID=1962290 RepID=UPI000B598C67|nr:fluoride efflux transporter CrcB [Leptolyngbya ohadii]